MVIPYWRNIFTNNDTMCADQGDPSQKRYMLTEINPSTRIFKGPLSKRAWVLQEQLLSQRTLHFGREQIFWQCHEFVANEIWPLGLGRSAQTGPLHFYQMQNAAIRCEQLNIDDLLEKEHRIIQDIWRYLMCTYAGRDITIPSDRLPALAGIAKEFGKALDYRAYRFGIWMGDPIAPLWAHTNESSVTYLPYRAWGLVLTRQSESGKAVYTRVGTAAFGSVKDNIQELFPKYRTALEDDDYIDMNEMGKCTITII
ncbi:hypothetical protein ST47_g6508 [Ascochyta rabiei]|uniref:Heterokaryon incompatibility domain-containing protein n=1 Tax=Didymella rabiei TaxID=5454 RepID=A0A163CBI0_DIDRA|nr:hypothetical protein ST47_g6508 [Ascochyta rabiei]